MHRSLVGSVCSMWARIIKLLDSMRMPRIEPPSNAQLRLKQVNSTPRSKTRLYKFPQQRAAKVLQDDQQHFNRLKTQLTSTSVDAIERSYAFEEWSQTNAQDWNANQNVLQREFDKYRVDAKPLPRHVCRWRQSQIYADQPDRAV